MGVDRKLVKPFLAGEIEEGLAPDIAGGGRRIVDQNIDPAEPLHRCRDKRLQVSLTGEIGGNSNRLAAHRLNLRERFAKRAWQSLVRINRACCRDNHSPALGKIERRLLAHAATGTGDDHHFASQIGFLLPFHRISPVRYFALGCRMHRSGAGVKTPRRYR